VKTATRTTRGTLTPDDVVAAAMKIVDAEGVPALTIRRLATDLGVTPMAIYRHVRDKDELLDRVVNEVAAGIGDPLTKGAWDERLMALFDNARAALLDHPGAALVAITRSTPVPAVAVFYDGVLAILDEAGFSDQDAVLIFDALLMFLFGSVLWQTPRRPTERGRLVALAGLLDAPPVHLLRHAAVISQRDPESYFRYGVRAIVEGVRSRAASDRRPSKAVGSARPPRSRRSV
jgi:AcrR family transcriptional regulator